MDENCSMLKCSNETMDGLHAFVPGLKDAHPDEKCARLLQHFHTLAQADKEDCDMEDSAMMSLSADKIHEKAKENRKKWKKNHITPLSDDMKEALVETFSTKLDVAFSKGAIDRVTKQKLEELFGIKNEINTFAFSKSAGQSKALAMSLVEVLMQNKPIEVSEKSGVQVLSRDSQKNVKLEEMNTFALQSAGVPTKKD